MLGSQEKGEMHLKIAAVEQPIAVQAMLGTSRKEHVIAGLGFVSQIVLNFGRRNHWQIAIVMLRPSNVRLRKTVMLLRDHHMPPDCTLAV